MTMDGGIMRMRRLDAPLTIPAGGEVRLDPGGLHLMMMGLKTPFREGDPRGWIELDLPGRPQKEVSYHVMLLGQAGLIEAQDLCSIGDDGFEWRPKSLTWQGHEFLDAARNDTIWKKAVHRVSHIVGSVSFDVMKSLLIDVAKQELGISE